MIFGRIPDKNRAIGGLSLLYLFLYSMVDMYLAELLLANGINRPKLLMYCAAE